MTIAGRFHRQWTCASWRESRQWIRRLPSWLGAASSTSSPWFCKCWPLGREGPAIFRKRPPSLRVMKQNKMDSENDKLALDGTTAATASGKRQSRVLLLMQKREERERQAAQRRQRQDPERIGGCGHLGSFVCEVETTRRFGLPRFAARLCVRRIARSVVCVYC